MSAITTSNSPVLANVRRRNPLSRVVWIIILFLALYFFFKAAFHYFFITPASYGPYWTNRTALLCHICGGTIALFLGPLQFWTGLRKRFLRFHRWTGRLYLSGVAVGAIGAFYLATHSVVGPAFGVALITLATVWVLSSAMALFTILRRNVISHREWVTRSYVLTFAFVIFRLLADSPFLSNFTNLQDRLVSIGWLCWTIPLFISELVLKQKRSAADTSGLSEASSRRYR
jgi:uncharacterized membrane protein